MKYTWIIWVCLLLGLVTWCLSLTQNITYQSEQLSRQIESQNALIKTFSQSSQIARDCTQTSIVCQKKPN